MQKHWKAESLPDETPVANVETALALCFYRPVPGAARLSYMKQLGDQQLFWQQHEAGWTFVSRSAHYPEGSVWATVTLDEGPLSPVEIYRLEGFHCRHHLFPPYHQRLCVFHEAAQLEQVT